MSIQDNSETLTTLPKARYRLCLLAIRRPLLIVFVTANPAAAPRAVRPASSGIVICQMVVASIGPPAPPAVNATCVRSLDSQPSFRWSGDQCKALPIIQASATPVYEFQLMLYTVS